MKDSLPPEGGARDLEPTIAMPAVAPPPRPRVQRGEVAPPQRPEDAEPVHAAPVEERPRAYRPVGNPLGYTIERFLAFAVDVLLVGYVVTSFAYAAVAINPITGLPTNTEAGFDTTLAIGLAVALAYVWLCEGLFGTTIGKLAFNLHVFAARGGMVGLGRSLIRMLLRPIDVLVIGAILSLLPGHRRLGDLLGGTIVARSPLRAFASLLGWIGIIVLAGLPWALVGTEKAFAALYATATFVPRLVAPAWHALLHAFGT